MSYSEQDLDQLGDYLTKLMNRPAKGGPATDSQDDSGDDLDAYAESGDDQDSGAKKTTPATAQGPAARLNRSKYFIDKEGAKVYQSIYGGDFHCTSDCGRFLYNVAKADDPSLPNVVIKDIRRHVMTSKNWTTGASASDGIRPGDLLFHNESHGAIYGGVEKGKDGKPIYITYEASLDDHNPKRKTWGSLQSIQRYFGRYARPKREK
ncbi:MAG TPA: hypothetical protein VHE55_11210 [Fimbriimonadaceae bacterium]|nr:hypothetical protein [Fimbriimonadaceae bacterium]